MSITSYGARLCGIYALSSAILITPKLPVVGYKLTFPDLLFLLLVFYYFVMAKNKNSANFNSGSILFLTLHVLFLIAGYFSLFFNGISYLGQSYIIPMSIEYINYIYGFLLTLITYSFINTKSDILFLMKCWIFGSIIVGLGSALAFIGIGGELFIDDFSGRISSTMRAINQVPSFIAPALAFSLVLSFNFFNEKNIDFKWLACGVLFSLIALLATGSRTSLGLAIIVFLSTLAYSYIFSGVKGGAFKIYRASLTLSFVLAVVIYFVLGFYYVESSKDIPALFRPIQLILTWGTGDLEATDTTRLDQIKVGIKSISDYPLFGIGAGAFMPRHQMNEIHNSFLGVAVGQGLIGVAILSMMLVLLFVILLHGIKVTHDQTMKAIGISLLISFTALIGYAFFIYGMRQRNFWLIVGVILAYYKVSLMHKIYHGDSQHA